ncbi:MAG: lysostaphin resistance A-like protein [Prevotella sp.]
MKKTSLDVTIYLVAFSAIQIIVSFGAALSSVFGLKPDDPIVLVALSATASIITLIIFLWRKWTPVGKTYIQRKPWATLIWSAVAALGVVIPSVWLQEQMPALPDVAGETLTKIISTPGGYFVIALLAPVVEEVVFRGAILRTLLSSMQSKWGAICFTAALFALIHANPAQMPHAFLMGLLMGWLYMRTGSILPAVVFHWANNTVAYFIAVAYPGDDMKLVDIFSGNETAVVMSVVFSLCIFLPALFQLNIWTKNRGVAK